jgi:hypothetical protein
MKIFDDARKYYPLIDEVISNSAGNPDVQGVVLETNTMWIQIFRLDEMFGRNWFTSKIHDLRPPFWYEFPFVELLVNGLAQIHLKNDFWIPSRILSLQDLIDLRKDIMSYWPTPKEYIPNIIRVRICLYPNSERKTEYNHYNSEQLGGIDIVYETRPISYLYSNPDKMYRPLLGGISIGTNANGSGTLGGILTDKKTNKNYGVTCSHVVGGNNEVFQPAEEDSKERKQIGTVIGKSKLVPLPKDDYYNKNLQSANEMDLALIELSEKAILKVLDIGAVSKVYQQYNMVPHINVSLTGKSSGYKPFLYTDSDVIFYDFKHGGETYRFLELMQIRIDGKWANFFSTPTTGGDSGAWVCTPDTNGVAWCGMIIGGYLQTGFAIASEKILDWIKNEIKLELTCC